MSSGERQKLLTKEGYYMLFACISAVITWRS